MKLNLGIIQERHPFFQTREKPGTREETVFTLDLQAIPEYQIAPIEWAELVLTKGFPGEGKARIRVSPSAVLALPHVEEGGWICLNGDPGPGYAIKPEHRIMGTLDAFEDFLWKYLAGELAEDFEKEALNYWLLWVNQRHPPHSPVRQVWTTDIRSAEACIQQGVLLIPNRTVLVGNREQIQRHIDTIGRGGKTEFAVRIADIPIDYPLVPTTWPKTTEEIDCLLKCRLTVEDQRKFLLPPGEQKKGRGQYRVVLLRHQQYGYAYLLPGGPHIRVQDKRRHRDYKPTRKPVPLMVHRLDPSWTIGRDQIPQVNQRQQQRVLIIGVGALGGPVADQLAKAGVGELVLVDNDDLESANLGRHYLGASHLGQSKVESMKAQLSRAYPTVNIRAHKKTIQTWLDDNTLEQYDLILDLTGMEEVRRLLDHHRKVVPCPLLIAWMEPFVAAAHVCLLPQEAQWLQNDMDSLDMLQAVSWPDEVIQQVPGCSSKFQSYTAISATYAVALAAEKTLDALDNNITHPQVYSWIRNQAYLDGVWEGLVLQPWAEKLFSCAAIDAALHERSFPMEEAS